MQARQHERHAARNLRSGAAEGAMPQRRKARATIIALTGNPHEQRLSGKRSKTCRGALQCSRSACVAKRVAIIVTAQAPDATRVTCDVPHAMTTRTLAACIDVSDYARQ
jgi:hypothetical protein